MMSALTFWFCSSVLFLVAQMPEIGGLWPLHSWKTLNAPVQEMLSLIYFSSTKRQNGSEWEVYYKCICAIGTGIRYCSVSWRDFVDYSEGGL